MSVEWKVVRKAQKQDFDWVDLMAVCLVEVLVVPMAAKKAASKA
jgi:hypothetical protein